MNAFYDEDALLFLIKDLLAGICFQALAFQNYLINNESQERMSKRQQKADNYPL